MRILEVIQSVDGTEERYDCELISIDEEKAIVKYIREREYDLGPVVLPRAGVTKGVYWKKRNFQVWKVFSPDGELLGYYINVCEDVQIDSERIVWTDLVLDLWVDISGMPHWLDEDEVEEYRARGLLSDAQMATIREVKQYLTNNYQNVISEADEYFEQNRRSEPQG